MKITKKTAKFWSKMEEAQNYEKHACQNTYQNTVAMETSNCLGQGMSYRIVAG